MAYDFQVVIDTGDPHSPADWWADALGWQVEPEQKTVKNRVHLDIRVGANNIEPVVERLTAKGAKVLHRGRQGPLWWITIADPEGNELCIT
ncbi:VOC family protein [Nonomuraea sp. B12E4]|uniref:VOC family protein n=1 Tax=Nonomuraea sp. B12E4 TaxID=3153564 RepID=UPI00325DD9F8